MSRRRASPWLRRPRHSSWWSWRPSYCGCTRKSCRSCERSGRVLRQGSSATGKMNRSEGLCGPTAPHLRLAARPMARTIRCTRHCGRNRRGAEHQTVRRLIIYQAVRSATCGPSWLVCRTTAAVLAARGGPRSCSSHRYRCRRTTLRRSRGCKPWPRRRQAAKRIATRHCASDDGCAQWPRRRQRRQNESSSRGGVFARRFV